MGFGKRSVNLVTKAKVQGQPLARTPVILDKRARFPRTKTLHAGLVPSCNEHISSGEQLGKICNPEHALRRPGRLAIVHLPANQGTARLDRLVTVVPGQHAVVLEGVVVIVNGDKGAITYRCGAVQHVSRAQSGRGHVPEVAVDHTDLIVEICSVVERERVNLDTRITGAQFEQEVRSEDMDVINTDALRVTGGGTVKVED